MIDFSVVMPVKDEADLLRYSLPALFTLRPQEIVLPVEPNREVLRSIVQVAWKFRHTPTTVRIIILDDDVPEWRDRHAFARRLGFKEAKNDVIFTIDVDKVADPKVKEHFKWIGYGMGLVSFSEVPRGFSFRVMVGRLLQKLGYAQSFMGTYVFSKKKWLETESEEKAKQVFSAEDTHLHECMKKSYDTLFIPDTKVVLLRPEQKKRYQYLVGVERRRHGASFLKTLIASIITLRPLTLVGWLQAPKLLGSTKRWR